MIVRTYGRRNRPISRAYSDNLDDDVSETCRDSLSQESSQDHLCGFAFSSQGSSSHWSAFDSDPCDTNSILPSRVPFDDLCSGVSRKSKRARTGKKETEVPKDCGLSIPATSTLMEAQEFGEMMEHVDEVNFALDGLRKGQPVRIRRASLVSLLSICGTAHQRRLLRTQGMAKAIIDAILRLSLDDSPSNLAAATLVHILTSDGQDDRLLESPSCVRFLIKLLRPIVFTASEDREPKLGSKLLALRQKADVLKNTTSRLDSSSVAVFSRVEEILVNCKELKTTCRNDSGAERPELCPMWLALLTIEKACISAISLDETTGAVRKANGNFKERLREHGGLDAVFEVAMNCYSDLESWMGDLSIKDLRNDKQLKSLTLLLKCLKIMENATFLSKDNQNHLLGMKRKLSPLATLLSFTELVIRIVKLLSDLNLRRSASTSSKDGKSCSPFALDGHGPQMDLLVDLEGNETLSRNYSRNYCGQERASLDKKANASHNSQLLTSSQLENLPSIYEISSTSMSDTCSLEMRVSSSSYGSCSGSSRSSDCKTNMAYNCSQKNVSSTDGIPVVVLDDSQDPFAFDEDEFQPSKWDLMSGKHKRNQSKKRELSKREFEDGHQSQSTVDHLESINDVSCSTSDVGDEEASSLLADCLLTAVKVLMNLTNDNPVGCKQIALHGGLETMSSLIAGHFPSFSSTSLSFSQIRENTSKVAISDPFEAHLTDHDLDFLVAILGLLVNLVEKDSQNRSRLAAASITLPASEGLGQEAQRDVIQLLCSIFLANQGGSEGSGEDKQLNDEAALLEGEKEAEKMIVEAYSALLLAFLSTESKSVREAIADNLPDRKLAILVPVLDRFVEFHLSLNMISPETHKAVSEVIESCRIP